MRTIVISVASGQAGRELLTFSALSLSLSLRGTPPLLPQEVRNPPASRAPLCVWGFEGIVKAWLWLARLDRACIQDVDLACPRNPSEGVSLSISVSLSLSPSPIAQMLRSASYHMLFWAALLFNFSTSGYRPGRRHRSSDTACELSGCTHLGKKEHTHFGGTVSLQRRSTKTCRNSMENCEASLQVPVISASFLQLPPKPSGFLRISLTTDLMLTVRAPPGLIIGIWSQCSPSKPRL